MCRCSSALGNSLAKVASSPAISPASYGRNVRGYQPPSDFLDGGAHGTKGDGDRRGMRSRRLRHTGDEPIFSATIPIASSRELNAVANRLADANRHTGADAAAGRVNTAADGGSNASTDPDSDDGRCGQDDRG